MGYFKDMAFYIMNAQKVVIGVENMKYTNTFKELLEYLDAKMEEYLRRKSLTEVEEMLVIERYEEEKEILEQQVERFPEIIRQMWFLAFLGQMAKEQGLVIRNNVLQCPFLMYLLKVVSYDVLEEGYGEECYLYKKTNIVPVSFYVGEKFYENAKDCIEQFFRKTGHVVLWVGYSNVCHDFPYGREPEGIVVFPPNTNISEFQDECGEMYDETTCILAECAPEMYDKGEWYQFIPMQREKQEMTDEKNKIVNAYLKNKISKSRAIKMLAAGYIDGYGKSADSYFEEMEFLGDDIYFREDLWKYLMKNGLQEDRAFFWTEIIRKGTLGWRIEKQRLSYGDYVELYETIGKERIELFCHVKYLPSKWSVMERFYWLTEKDKKKKIIAIDFDGTLSLGEWPYIGAANEELIDFLKDRKKNGDKLILWTCREGGALEEAVEWCKEQGLVFDAVNDNIPEMIELYGTNSRKISCDYYIDDKAVLTNAFGVLG